MKLPKFLSFLMYGKEKEEAKSLKEEILKGRHKDIQSLRTINKSVKLLLDEGSIEIAIKNVRGVLHEDYKKKKRI